MKKKIILFFLLITILGFSLPSIAQFEPEEIAERAEWEEFLQTAKVVDQVQMGGREAVTRPWRLTLEKEGKRNDALWKNPEGRTSSERSCRW